MYLQIHTKTGFKQYNSPYDEDKPRQNIYTQKKEQRLNEDCSIHEKQSFYHHHHKQHKQLYSNFQQQCYKQQQQHRTELRNNPNINTIAKSPFSTHTTLSTSTPSYNLNNNKIDFKKNKTISQNNYTTKNDFNNNIYSRNNDQINKNDNKNDNKNTTTNNSKSIKKPTTTDDLQLKVQQNLPWPAWVYCTRYSDRPSSGKPYILRS